MTTGRSPNGPVATKAFVHQRLPAQHVISRENVQSRRLQSPHPDLVNARREPNDDVAMHMITAHRCASLGTDRDRRLADGGGVMTCSASRAASSTRIGTTSRDGWWLKCRCVWLTVRAITAGSMPGNLIDKRCETRSMALCSASDGTAPRCRRAGVPVNPAFVGSTSTDVGPAGFGARPGGGAAGAPPTGDAVALPRSLPTIRPQPIGQIAQGGSSRMSRVSRDAPSEGRPSWLSTARGR